MLISKFIKEMLVYDILWIKNNMIKNFNNIYAFY